MKHKLHLLIIDPQNDFCDLPPEYLPAHGREAGPAVPALPVAGAHADMLRLAELINRGLAGLTDITVTLDSHHRIDIAHSIFWMDAERRPVPSFTRIRAEDVRAGKYLPRREDALPRALMYLDALEAGGRYTLMAWPVHCEIGTWGHNVHPAVRAAYNRWEELTLGVVNKVVKGTNPWTEHYSAIQAEVPDPGDPDTQLNRALIGRLAGADRIYITGEAGSHCVKATTEHIADHFDPASLSKLVLVTDCMSPVAGFESHFSGFVRDMAERGLQLASAADVLPEMMANARQ